jgi:hypothetical protein
MRRVAYAGGSFVTGSEIAEAIMFYAASLGNDDRAAFLTVPTVNEDGERSDALLLIGPASQLLATHSSYGPELEAPEFVERLRAEAEVRVRAGGVDPTPFK